MLLPRTVISQKVMQETKKATDHFISSRHCLQFALRRYVIVVGLLRS